MSECHKILTSFLYYTLSSENLSFKIYHLGFGTENDRHAAQEKNC